MPESHTVDFLTDQRNVTLIETAKYEYALWGDDGGKTNHILKQDVAVDVGHHHIIRIFHRVE